MASDIRYHNYFGNKIWGKRHIDCILHITALETNIAFMSSCSQTTGNNISRNIPGFIVALDHPVGRRK